MSEATHHQNSEILTATHRNTPQHTTTGGIKGVSEATNIVFSNGGLDPWSFGGVTPKTPLPPSASSSLGVVWIPEGAHHLDLFFSNPADPPSVIAARQTEMAFVRKWLDSSSRRGGERGGGGGGGARETVVV